MLKSMLMRRIQIAGLILAVLAAPLALLAGAQAGAAQECAMACCRGRHVSATMMKCGHAAKGGAMACIMGCESQPTAAYALNAALPKISLAQGAVLPVMLAMRGHFAAMTVLDLAGYFPPPFNPPRA